MANNKSEVVATTLLLSSTYFIHMRCPGLFVTANISVPRGRTAGCAVFKTGFMECGYSTVSFCGIFNCYLFQ